MVSPLLLLVAVGVMCLVVVVLAQQFKSYYTGLSKKSYLAFDHTKLRYGGNTVSCRVKKDVGRNGYFRFSGDNMDEFDLKPLFGRGGFVTCDRGDHFLVGDTLHIGASALLEAAGRKVSDSLLRRVEFLESALSQSQWYNAELLSRPQGEMDKYADNMKRLKIAVETYMAKKKPVSRSSSGGGGLY